MKDRLNAYIQGLFADAERRSPANGRLAELKEELLLNTEEKYDHLVSTGKTPEVAYRMAVDGIGDISELLDDVIGKDAVKEASTSPTVEEPKGGEADRDKDDENEDDDEDDDDDDDGDDDDEKSARPPRSRWYALVSGIIWTVVLVAYFAVSFSTHAWNVTWLLFIMGIAADNVAKCIFDLRR